VEADSSFRPIWASRRPAYSVDRMARLHCQGVKASSTHCWQHSTNPPSPATSAQFGNY